MAGLCKMSFGMSIVVAVAENGVIGRAGDLPWRLSADLRRFKQLTMGHAVIMGRRTHQSIKRPLPGRRVIVVTRQANYHVEGGEAAPSLPAACAQAAAYGYAEAMVIGGAEIFEQALPMAARLYLTRVHARPAGDVYFPPYDAAAWRLIAAEPHEADARNEFPFTFEIYERIAP
ncbi:MAG: hypothetical protein DCC67_02210 [Planctomycetota bacterium]|nr:MAG: hypothetical protein DCC67_02210 [Planctomycetota bacterium]